MAMNPTPSRSAPGPWTIVAIVVATALVALALGGVVVGGALLVPRPASGPPSTLVVTTWVADPSVTGGPYPGYRPQLTSITPDMVASATPQLDPNGGDQWVVTITFDARGKRIFGELTTAAAAACGSAGSSSCPEGRVTDWLDLTQADIDDWNDRGTVLYAPTANGGKLLADPYILAPITGGQGYIAGAYTRADATELARQLHR